MSAGHDPPVTGRAHVPALSGGCREPENAAVMVRRCGFLRIVCLFDGKSIDKTRPESNNNREVGTVPRRKQEDGMDYSITAHIIRNARIRRGITQKELAARLGITHTAVSKWERGVSRT